MLRPYHVYAALLPCACCAPTMCGRDFQVPWASGSGSERCESACPVREAGDRPEGREVPVRLYAERVDRLRAAGLQHVQVPAVVAQRDVVDAGADQRGATVRIDQADRPVRRDREGRHRAGAVAGEADAPVIGHNGPAWCVSTAPLTSETPPVASSS